MNLLLLFSKGITNTSLTKDNILVLGNMCCTLDGSYIQNSDPSILETLKNCSDLSYTQAAAVQTMLLSGNTQYGYVNSTHVGRMSLTDQNKFNKNIWFHFFRAPSTWNGQTLVNLGMLPLYLTTTFYQNFDQVSNS